MARWHSHIYIYLFMESLIAVRIKFEYNLINITDSVTVTCCKNKYLKDDIFFRKYHLSILQLISLFKFYLIVLMEDLSR